MDTTWLDRSIERLGDAAATLTSRFERLSDPAVQRRVWQCLCAAALLWIFFGLAELLWSLAPTPRAEPWPEGIVNPVSEYTQQTTRPTVDIDRLTSWPLFGSADSAVPAPVDVQAATVLDGDLAGIERDAEDTDLPLMLAGIVFSSDPDLTRAVIEARKEQAQYAMGDTLPVGNEVSVAKILPDRIVLDNKGKYELLRLFDDQEVARQIQAADTDMEAATDRRQTRKLRNDSISAMAEAHRKRRYGDPTSLSQVMNIAPVNDDGVLAGFRVSAGRDRAQFEALGFRADDVIVAVNGTSLTEPGKGIELFRVLRSAKEATFEVLRDGEQISINVGMNQSLGQ